MRNSGATSQNSVLFSDRHFRNLDSVRPYRIQLRYVLHRPSCGATRLGMPPFVLCVCANLTSAALTDRSEDGDSQAERALTKCRSISLLCTILRLAYMAWEVRVSVVPDFRLHPSSEIGSLPFCQLGQTICQRTDPSKIPLKTASLQYTNRLPQIKVFAELFSKSDRFPFTNAPHSPTYKQLTYDYYLTN